MTKDRDIHFREAMDIAMTRFTNGLELTSEVLYRLASYGGNKFSAALLLASLLNLVDPVMQSTKAYTPSREAGLPSDVVVTPPEQKGDITTKTTAILDTVRHYIETEKNNGARAIILFDRLTGELVQGVIVSPTSELHRLAVTENGTIVVSDTKEMSPMTAASEEETTATTLELQPDMELITNVPTRHAVEVRDPAITRGVGLTIVDLIEPHEGVHPSIVAFWTYPGATLDVFTGVRDYQDLTTGRYDVTRVTQPETPMVPGLVMPTDIQVMANAFPKGAEVYQYALKVLGVSDGTLFQTQAKITKARIARYGSYLPITQAGSK